jgi:hypothetical protein
MAYKCGLGAGDYSPAEALLTVNRMVAGSSPARGAIALFAFYFLGVSGRFAKVRGKVRG